MVFAPLFKQFWFLCYTRIQDLHNYITVTGKKIFTKSLLTTLLIFLLFYEKYLLKKPLICHMITIRNANKVSATDFKLAAKTHEKL